jgi:hypothetical protein
LLPELPLKLLLPPLGTSRFIEQALEVLLDHLSSPVCLRKLTLEKGDPSSKALYLLTSKALYLLRFLDKTRNACHTPF